MAEIRCQMCGKTNPDDLDVCQFCGARLKPLFTSSQPDMDQQWGDPEGDEVIPDWLRELRGAEPDSRGESLGDLGEDTSQDSPVPAAGSEDLDWLARIGGSDDLLSQPEPDVSGGEPEFPDWLTVASGGIPAGEESVQEQPQEEGEFDWLRRVRELKQEDHETEDITELLPGEAALLPEAEEELPDWLSRTADGALFTVGDAGEEKPSELPEWLSASQPVVPPFTSEDEDIASIESEIEQAGAEESSAAEPVEVSEEMGLSSSEAVEVPDWLSNLNAVVEEVPLAVEAQEPDLAVEKPFDEPVLSGEGEPEVLPETPEWLAGVSTVVSEGQPPEPDQPVAEPSANLEQASLPEWLEAMRPIESAVPPRAIAGSPDEGVEGAGPLAGLRGVLQAEPEVGRARKPSVYSVKLQIPEEQQNQLALLQGLVASETKPKSLPSPSIISVPFMLRLVIFTLLVLAVVWSLISGGHQVLGTGDVQDFPELLAFKQTVDGLSPAPNVLISVDYEPGFSGELDLAATSVVSHLVGKNAYVAFVSSTSNGPMMAERLVQQANTKMNRSDDLAYHTNLGYIPGGAAGVLSFASAPQKMIRYDLNGYAVWQNNPLQEQKGFDNFSMVLVITDNPDTARLWIEQVGPLLREKEIPLLMILSAQAEPLVMPYHSSYLTQVNGIITGLRGGVLYESLVDPNAIPWKQWGAYSLVLLLSVIIVLVGGVVNLFSALIEQSKKTKSEGKK